MKTLLVCLLLALAGQSLAQSQDEFVDYLIGIQNEAEAVHQMMEETFDNIRFSMSEGLIELNRQLIARMNEALEEIEEVREDTEAFVGESSAPASCVDVVVANWEREIEWAGQALSRCASNANIQITSRTAEVHDALEAAQIASTELQNIVVRGFIDWNAIDATEELGDIVSPQIDERESYFRLITQPALERALQGVLDLDDNLLPEVLSCVNQGVGRFSNYGQVIRDTLRAYNPANMKSLLVCLLLALAGQSLAQSQEEFVEYLLEIQYQAEAIHQLMEGTFDNVRFSMSDQLIELNRQLIARMNEALEEIEQIREDTEAFVGESSAPANCVDVAVANWEIEIEWAGQALSRCASEANVQITSRTADVHAALENAQIASTELQNIVVRGFIDWNAIDYTEQISSIVGAQIEDKYDYFTRITQPALERALQGVFDLDDNLLPEILTCVNRGVERFSNYGRVIRDTLFFCSQ
uniref:Uncharacterized protein n=2 Tax=Anopheles albimanus TaxID=7167 RepID=A0A182F256_ANOAL